MEFDAKTVGAQLVQVLIMLSVKCLNNPPGIPLEGRFRLEKVSEPECLRQTGRSNSEAQNQEAERRWGRWEIGSIFKQF